MPISISRLRAWFAGALVFVIVVVAGTYFSARHHVENALKQVPEKMGYEIQQSAQGFTISKSEQGRTIFKVQASKAVQFKQGHADLHDVTITIYGRDGTRFDQVYGKQFEYDQETGNITGQGEVLIDLQANPQGLAHPDQAAPKELKNPIHVRTTNLVFNQKSGDGWTPAPLEFSIPQANGSAVGASYKASDGVLVLQSDVRIFVHGETPTTIVAERARLEKNPRDIVLEHSHAESPEQRAQADEATFYLRPDNTLDHAFGSGNVILESKQKEAGKPSSGSASHSPGANSAALWSRVFAQRVDVRMKQQNRVETAILSGDVKAETMGAQPGEASAGRAVLSFGPTNVLTEIHAEQHVRMFERQSSESGAAQDVEVTAPAMDYFLADGERLTRAVTIGPPQIRLLPTNGKQGPTRITADKFTANFDSLGQLAQVHGELHARVVTSASPGVKPPGPDRISTSHTIDAYFRPGTGIETLVQAGDFAYSSGTQKAFADRARYTPADQILTLSGSPRVLDTGMETVGNGMRLNRSTGEAFVFGNVQTSYTDLKSQPNGALLASSDPIHVNAESMTAHSNPDTAVYNGNARLWQDVNLVQAPSIEFHKAERMVIASSPQTQQVATTLVQTDSSGKATPVTVTSNHLVYVDAERQAHYEGDVTVRGQDMTVTSKRMDVFLEPASQDPSRVAGQNPAPNSGLRAKLEKIIASGSVILTQPNRRGTGDRLVYTASDDKFVLTGGPPSIFDAEHGKITGVSLTLYRLSDRVVVKGDSSSPAVTQTRVVR
jgi:lipopolysaccharide export system protein LptA